MPKNRRGLSIHGTSLTHGHQLGDRKIPRHDIDHGLERPAVNRRLGSACRINERLVMFG